MGWMHFLSLSLQCQGMKRLEMHGKPSM